MLKSNIQQNAMYTCSYIFIPSTPLLICFKQNIYIDEQKHISTFTPINQVHNTIILLQFQLPLVPVISLLPVQYNYFLAFFPSC